MTDEIDKFFAWRESMRRKPRTMTIAEYSAWCRNGDAISHPSSANAFPGGLTITFGPSAGILGRVDE